jgi:hypothetical protein
MGALAGIAAHTLVIEIGGVAVLVRTGSAEFLGMLQARYSGFVNSHARPLCELEVELVPPGKISDEDEVAVRFIAGSWLIERGDLRVTWDPVSGQGSIRQSANPYSIDTALRIIHSLILAKRGGLLVHAASAVRNGKAFLFAGVSGAGKTTISRLAPPDATLLTDEISYLRRNGHGYLAHGTPFAGELAKVGENVQAPLAALFLLRQAPENKIQPVREGEAVRALMESILFFAHDSELVNQVFESACDLARRVPVFRLSFVPDHRVWELIA